MTAEATRQVAPGRSEPLANSVPARSRWRRAVHGVRTQILAWFVVLLAAATVTSVLVERQVLLARLSERVDEQLAQEVTELRQLIGGQAADGSCISDQTVGGECDVGRDPATGEPFGDDVRAIFDTFLRRNTPSQHETLLAFVDGALYRSAPRAPATPLVTSEPLLRLADAENLPRRGEVLIEGHGMARYLAVPLGTSDGRRLGVFAVAQLLEPQRTEIDEVMKVALAVGIGTLAVTSLVAFLATGRVLAPVRIVMRTAHRISENDLSQRIPVKGDDDEISALARTFNEMLDRLETSFATQRTFIDDAGHELRTPITIIRGHLELLDDDPDERRETVAIVLDELDRMNRMVDDLLVLARAERPDFLSLDVVELGALTDDLLLKAAALAPREWRLEHRGEGQVVADRHRLTQATMQLAQNATQHTGDGDLISLGSIIWDGDLRLWVRDTGPGVAPEDSERIFQRFARAPASRRRSEGAGLGLSIVRAIAEAHDGRVELHSQPGGGAVFTVVVPAVTPADTTPDTRRSR